MIGWIILAVWVVGFWFTWPSTAKAILAFQSYGEPDGEDKLFAAFFGGAVALFWPIAVPVRWMAGKL